MAEKAVARESGPFGSQMWAKLAADPTTAAYLQDPNFVQKMNMLSSNPNLLTGFAQSDPQVGAAVGVLLGLGANAFASMQGGHGGPGGPPPRTGPTAAERRAAEEAAAAEAKRKEEEEEARRKQEELDSMDDEERAELKRKEDSLELKNQGNAFYKAKNWDAAIEKYEAAIALDPDNPFFLTNVAAVLSSKKQYEECIAKCKEALELAQRVRLRDYSFNAKAWLRIGNAHLMRKEYKEAIAAYDESLLEDGTDLCRSQKAKAEKRLKKKQEQEYLNPELAIEAKNRGNALYQEGKFPQAIEEYNDAIKRDPTNHVFYSNRANCLAKLMSWAAALEDCEKCIKIKPDFVKIYIRKGKIQHFTKAYHKALATYDIGLSYDPSCSELQQAKMETIRKIQEQNQSGEVDPERVKEAQKDPEIQAILRDPTVNNVLQAMQSDPSAAQRALRDPVISAKINKLVQAGILAVR